MGERRRKCDSKRRWKARCRIGRLIPLTAIREHKLDHLFLFAEARDMAYCDIYVSLGELPRG